MCSILKNKNNVRNISKLTIIYLQLIGRFVFFKSLYIKCTFCHMFAVELDACAEYSVLYYS